MVFDIGAGVQRVAEQGAAIGPWGRALRLYSLIVVPLAVGRDLRLDFDGEQSAFVNELATAGVVQLRHHCSASMFRWMLAFVSRSGFRAFARRGMGSLIVVCM